MQELGSAGGLPKRFLPASRSRRLIVHFSISDLGLFVRIAELENLTKGAERSALSPAAASARLKSLEGQFNCPLFYRRHRGVKLTPAGETLLRHAQVILSQVDQLRNEFALQAPQQGSSVPGELGAVRIYANTTAVTELLPEVLADYLIERSGVTVDLQEKTTEAVVSGVQAGEADIGIVAGPVDTKELQSWCFARDRLVLAVPKSHPIASRHCVVSFKDSLQFGHVCMDEGHTLQVFVRGKARKLKIDIPVRMQTRTYETMCRMIAAGVGIGVLPESTVMRYRSNLELDILALSDPWTFRERKILVRSLQHLPGYARAFVYIMLRYEKK